MSQQDTFKVLSIDGGGIRGIIPAMILAKIEKKTEKPIAENFDLIAGTSTGGILALGLSKKGGNDKPQYQAKELVEIYENRGSEIFNRSLWKGVSSVGGLADEKYSHEGLEKVLDEYFGKASLKEAFTNTLISCYDISAREPLFLKSWKENHGSVKMKAAARATSAAPTYFEPTQVCIESEMRTLIDGGVFINTPVVSAYAEAKRILLEKKNKKGCNASNIFVLSLGTGKRTRKIKYQDAKDWGKAEWLSPVLSCIFDGVSDAAHYQMDKFLGADNYIHLQPCLYDADDDMDNASKGNIKNLKDCAKNLIKNKSSEIDKICRLLNPAEASPNTNQK